MPDPVDTGARTRVALLASAGKAAEQLAEAVRQAGAELVLSGDPAAIAPDQVRAAGASAVVIALEPRIESALERFDEVLDDPSMLVIYDEADVAAHRTGWDAARWVRHLSAKLHGHDNVLPPGAEVASAVIPQPGIAAAPAARAAPALDMAPFAEEATARADAVPADAMPSGDADAFQAILAEADAMLAVEGLTLDDATVQAPQRDAALDAMTAPMELAGDAFEGLGVDALEIEDRLAVASVAPAPRELAPGEGDAVMAELAAATLPTDAAATPALTSSGDSFDVGDLDLTDFDLSAFQLDSTTTASRDVEVVPSLEDLLASAAPPSDGTPEPAADAPAVPAADVPAPAPAAPSAPAGFSFANLSLADDDPPPAATPAASSAPKAAPDLSTLTAKISSLSLVDMEESAPRESAPAVHVLMPEAVLPPALEPATPPAVPPPLPPTSVGGPPPLPPLNSGLSLLDDAPVAPSAAAAPVSGAVLVEAGLGGPDPVRQLLAALPARFPVPVLVRLPLQGGHYDRLVTQMSRAAAMPVVLAQAGQRAVANTIHFLPDGVGLAPDANGVAFAAGVGRGENFDALPIGNAAVVFLSGADPDLVEAAMTAGATGALVAAQTPEDCYDGIACAGLRVRGVETALPAAIAAQLATRWPS